MRVCVCVFIERCEAVITTWIHKLTFQDCHCCGQSAFCPLPYGLYLWTTETTVIINTNIFYSSDLFPLIQCAVKILKQYFQCLEMQGRATALFFNMLKQAQRRADVAVRCGQRPWALQEPSPEHLHGKGALRQVRHNVLQDRPLVGCKLPMGTHSSLLGLNTSLWKGGKEREGGQIRTVTSPSRELKNQIFFF